MICPPIKPARHGKIYPCQINTQTLPPHVHNLAVFTNPQRATKLANWAQYTIIQYPH